MYVLICLFLYIRIKKWWFSMFSLSLSASAVNAWRLQQHIKGKKEPYLSFLRELVTDMLSTHGKTPNRRQPSKQDKSRHDNICHLIVPISDEGGKKVVRRCSRHCFQTKEKDFKTSFKCEKCDAPLQVLCFKDFILANFNKKHLYSLPLPSLPMFTVSARSTRPSQSLVSFVELLYSLNSFDINYNYITSINYNYIAICQLLMAILMLKINNISSFSCYTEVIVRQEHG